MFTVTRPNLPNWTPDCNNFSNFFLKKKGEKIYKAKFIKKLITKFSQDKSFYKHKIYAGEVQ